jgi:lysozyme
LIFQDDNKEKKEERDAARAERKRAQRDESNNGNRAKRNQAARRRKPTAEEKKEIEEATPVASTDMKTSKRGVKFIKQHEGSVIDDDGIHRMYEDQAGHLTIGYGHLIRPNELKSGIYEEGLTEEEAEDLLARDLSDAEAAVNRLVEAEINQNQFDAMVSFTFNLGPGAMQNLAEVVNREDWEGAAHKIGLYNKVTDPASGKKITSRGLLRRRTEEIELFKEPYEDGLVQY